jgi:hypothetical protein
MDIELVKYMSATRDLIYAVLAINGLLTIAVILHIAVKLKQLYKSGSNGHEKHDPLTVGYFDGERAKAAAADAKRDEDAVEAIVKAVDVRHLAQMAEYRYQRKKMNTLLIIQRRIHDYMIFKIIPPQLPPIIESDEMEDGP